MLNHLDELLRIVLTTGWQQPPQRPDLSFLPPDEDFKRRLERPTLNLYLSEVKENRDFRRSQWDTLPQSSGMSVLSMPPSYYDCHYLISAWSPAQDDGSGTSPIIEHALLGAAMRVLQKNPDVVPAAIGMTAGGVVFLNAHVYLTIAAPEGPKVLTDFWSTMRVPLRPTVSLVATAPLDPLRDDDPAQVMTMFVQRYREIDSPTDRFEELIQVGGWVLRGATTNPIPNATVIHLSSGRTIITDAQGRFTFEGLLRGRHKFRASAAGTGTVEHDIDLPNATMADHFIRLS